jgi:hypothetical protein
MHMMLARALGETEPRLYAVSALREGARGHSRTITVFRKPRFVDSNPSRRISVESVASRTLANLRRGRSSI